MVDERLEKVKEAMGRLGRGVIEAFAFHESPSVVQALAVKLAKTIEFDGPVRNVETDECVGDDGNESIIVLADQIYVRGVVRVPRWHLAHRPALYRKLLITFAVTDDFLADAGDFDRMIIYAITETLEDATKMIEEALLKLSDGEFRYVKEQVEAGRV